MLLDEEGEYYIEHGSVDLNLFDEQLSLQELQPKDPAWGDETETWKDFYFVDLQKMS